MIDIEKLEYWAGKKEKENYKFRTFLKNYADPEELDSHFKELHEKLFSEHDCSNCGNCCIKYRGTIPIEDLLADAECLGITVEELKEKYLQSEPNPEGYNTKNTPCDFLEEGECILGDNRPESCKAFPYTDKEDRIGSLLNIVENTFICPVVYEMLEQLKIVYRFR